MRSNTDVRDAIHERLKVLGWSRYRLATALGHHHDARLRLRMGKPPVATTSLYSFLAGTSELNTAALGHVLKALDLEIRPAMPELFNHLVKALDAKGLEIVRKKT